jgi:hypothetical protein
VPFDLHLTVADALKSLSDVFIVWLVFVGQTFNMVENVLYFGDVLRSFPKFIFRVCKALVFKLLYFVHVVALRAFGFPPI